MKYALIFLALVCFACADGPDKMTFTKVRVFCDDYPITVTIPMEILRGCIVEEIQCSCVVAVDSLGGFIWEPFGAYRIRNTQLLIYYEVREDPRLMLGDD